MPIRCQNPYRYFVIFEIILTLSNKHGKFLNARIIMIIFYFVGNVDW